MDQKGRPGSPVPDWGPRFVLTKSGLVDLKLANQLGFEDDDD
jgi:hypothetical protein